MLVGITIGTIIILFFVSGIRIVRPVEKGVVEFLGKYTSTREQGFQWIIPFLHRMIKVNITERAVDVPPQKVITQDKLNAEVDAVVYYQIKDVKKSLYNVDDHRWQLTSLARTTLRAVIGKMTLADANEKRSEVNIKVAEVLDKETDSYGVNILRVEIQRIEPPQDVQTSMNEVVKAEQEKIAALDRATALETEADGEKRAKIKVAEGTKKSAILEAQGKSKAFKLINKEFKDNAVVERKLSVTENSLKDNAKIVLTEKGITPTLLIGDLPLKK